MNKIVKIIIIITAAIVFFGGVFTYQCFSKEKNPEDDISHKKEKTISIVNFVSDNVGISKMIFSKDSIMATEKDKLVYISGILNIELTFGGIPGTSYIIQKTTSLSPPIFWITLTNMTADVNGFFVYNDPIDLAPNSVGFYRTIIIVPPTGTCLWSQHFGGSTINVDMAFPASVQEDKNGNVVVVGRFYGKVNFGGGVVTSTNGQEMFVVKYDYSGTYLWSQQISSSGGNKATGVVVDSGNNLVVVGSFAGTIDFGSEQFNSAGSSDIFVTKFAPNGTLVWAKRFGGSAAEVCNAVALDGTNNILITGCYGYYGTAVDFGGGALPLSGGTTAWQNDIYVVKLSSSGNYIWAKGYSGMGDVQSGGIAIDDNGNVAITGGFQKTINFGGASLTSTGGYDIFVAKYSGATGNHIWSLSGGGSGYDFSNAIAFDSNGNVVITGVFYGTANIGGNILSSPYNPGLPAMFLAKFSSTGTTLWSRGFIPSFAGGQASGNGVVVDSVGNIIVTGFVSGFTEFDGTYLGGGDSDILLVKFSTIGNTLWAKSYGGPMTDIGSAVNIGIDNNIFAIGYFTQSVNFGCGQMQSASSNDGFVVKLIP